MVIKSTKTTVFVLAAECRIRAEAELKDFVFCQDPSSNQSFLGVILPAKLDQRTMAIVSLYQFQILIIQ